MTKLTNTSDEIIRCARTLIIAGGYNGFSYADIADVVGIRKASIHHHFPSKVDLVRTLLQLYREEAKACIGDPTSSFCVCALLASQIPVLPPEIVVEVRAHFRTLSTWLASVIEEGAMQNAFLLTGTAQSEAESFMAAVHGAMLSARVYGDEKVFSVVTEPLIERLINDQGK